MRRGGLTRRYVIVLVALVTGALVTGGALQLRASKSENQAALVALQREKAIGAAARIEAFVRDIERQLGWTTHAPLVTTDAALDARQLDALRLQRQAPPITELTYIDANGREQLFVSRLIPDRRRSGLDLSKEPKFLEARGGKTWFGPVYFRKESEPYMTIAAPLAGGGVAAADVNLKFILDVVSQIKVGTTGLAFAVDGSGALIAHPDISLVLQKTSLAHLPQVAAGLTPSPDDDLTIARDLKGVEVLTANSRIPSLGWVVFVEQPLTEAFAPVRASAYRIVGVVLAGIALSVVASLFLARRLARPIQSLQESAARIGAGELDHQITLRTGDELEALADEFNRMTGRLRESYVTLEQKVEDRTRELSQSLEQQTATGEILGVISSSPTDVQPVFDTIVRSTKRLCEADRASVVLLRDSVLHRVAGHLSEGEGPDWYPRPLAEDTLVGRAILRRSVVHVADSAQELGLAAREPGRRSPVRAQLTVPMMLDGVPIGAINATRHAPGLFSDSQVALLQIFADQAVIAIQNVRLFTELQARTADLTRSVGELEALGEVGRAISSTLDLERVLDTIVSRANELAGADGGAIYEYEDTTGRFHLRATHNFAADFVALLRQTPLEPGEGAVGRAGTTREPVQVADIADAGGYTSRVRDALLGGGYRALLAVPLLSEDEVVGALVVNRRQPGEFSPRAVELLRTFATQSALAIQNARLFREIEDKSRELEAANRHKDEFLASMSHELRTPLNAVIGFSEVLLEKMFGDVNAKQEEYLNDILASGRHLLSLINDILDLAKIEAGRMEIDVEEFDLAPAIDNALVLIRERATRKSLVLETRLAAGLGSVRGDQRKIKQVLVNLLSNAVKFTPEGGRIEVAAERVDGHVEVAVTDTGIGIAPEDHDAVFEEFRQVGTDYAKKHEGTGLGLALSRKFVELHGGRIWLKSRPGEGSTFTFTIPVA